MKGGARQGCLFLIADCCCFLSSHPRRQPKASVQKGRCMLSAFVYRVEKRQERKSLVLQIALCVSTTQREMSARQKTRTCGAAPAAAHITWLTQTFFMRVLPKMDMHPHLLAAFKLCTRFPEHLYGCVLANPLLELRAQPKA
ncbi:hypothetical protein GQ54DRAFT_169595 [Martensiomyces pterosporus]|nr:hypothetical protein GQ54DRAFT_169595 [Martensiomyces pterosporus]